MNTERVLTHPFWVQFKDRPSGCVEDISAEAAMEQAKAYGRPTVAQSLPYPATPRLSPPEKRSSTPPFCYQPGKCQGKRSCPARPACSE
jgi:hypothetical protein